MAAVITLAPGVPSIVVLLVIGIGNDTPGHDGTYCPVIGCYIDYWNGSPADQGESYCREDCSAKVKLYSAVILPSGNVN
jgi:hypothetical protein